ncbi:MAG: redox-sensing transcriptional repressor Rex [Lachnospiraceae bacterium]|nr:redox-sensing transcriptional repressor Rex [Lachnospiraceae bacterium]
MERSNIPAAVVGRLPRYYRYLGELIENGVGRISSDRLSELMGVTASQIRQDLNHFGGFGQQGYGYNTSYLYQEIGELLGLNDRYDMILIGAGNLGEALAAFINGSRLNQRFIAAFDINEELFGRYISDVPVLSMQELKDFTQKHSVSIAVLAVPGPAAADAAAQLAGCRIRAVWNFTNAELELPEDILVEDVHLMDSMRKLTYGIHARNLKGVKDHDAD